jgi:branched-chain amino acid transport system ATP-binding protein
VGERRAIIGPNGAGKSTLFDVFTGRQRPDEGTVALLGTDVTGRRPDRIARLGVGRAFQTSRVFNALSVLENVQLAVMARERVSHRIVGRAWRLFRDEAEELLATVGLAGFESQRADVLSHGDQRALEMALSLALRPKLLLLDEPTAGMAPEETRRAMQLVRKVAERNQLTVVFTEHDMEVVFGIADSITVLADGRVLMTGSPAEVRSDARVRAIYLGKDG